MNPAEATEKTGKTEEGEKKEKTRLFDETGKRLLREIWPLRGWILLLSVFCLLLIGCAVAVPELLGAAFHRVWTCVC